MKCAETRLTCAGGRKTAQPKNLNQRRRKLSPYCLGFAGSAFWGSWFTCCE